VRRFAAAFFLSVLSLFGVRRFAAAFFLSLFNKQQAKQSGGKAPHSKKAALDRETSRG